MLEFNESIFVKVFSFSGLPGVPPFFFEGVFSSMLSSTDSFQGRRTELLFRNIFSWRYNKSIKQMESFSESLCLNPERA